MNPGAPVKTRRADRKAAAPFDRTARSVLDTLLEGCQVIGFDWRYVYVNDAWARGRSLIGRSVTECTPGIETTARFALLRRCMSERTHAQMDDELTLPDGTTGWFKLRFVPVPEGICILSADVSAQRRSGEARRQTEEQLRQAQKMEAVGRLAGRVAHDFNNILSVVLSYGELMLAALPPGAPLREDALKIIEAGERGGELTGQLLSFSRRQVLAPKVVDLNEMLLSMDNLFQRVLGADVDLVSRPAQPLGRVRVDPGGIEQVVLNLVVNARDAMPQGGKLTLETSNVVLDDRYARAHVGVAPGPHVMLAVTDTGIGMDRTTLTRVFEPFFTTKEKGTGLGLSTAFGIVQSSGGDIWVYSEPGQGTSFKVYLPRVDAPIDDLRNTPAPTIHRGSETILLVENDDPLRVVARDFLSQHGYHILDARGAGEALLRSEQYEGTIHLLLSDVVMPEMSGPELARRLGVRRPGMRILCMSGFPDDSIVRHGVLPADVAFIQKPITPDRLTAKVREVLDA